MKFWFLHICKVHSFSFQIITKLCKSANRFKSYYKSIWLPQRVPFWEIGLRKFVSHTTVLQQLQFKMPETVIKHRIWPSKVMFSNRKMPEAPDFDENRKSIFLACGSKIVALCNVAEYQCDSFRAIGSHVLAVLNTCSHIVCLTGWPSHTLHMSQAKDENVKIMFPEESKRKQTSWCSNWPSYVCLGSWGNLANT